MIRAVVDDFFLAVGTFRAHPLRTSLTLLGVVIGVATVIIMMALLEGLSTKVNQEMSWLGANTFRVDKWPGGIHIGGSSKFWEKYQRRKPLRAGDREAIIAQCPSVQAVSAHNVQGAQKLSTSDIETQPSLFIMGATPEFISTGGMTVSRGRFVSDADDADAQASIVIGADVATRLFPSVDPLGQSVRLKNKGYTVVGVLQRRGQLLGMINMDNMAVLPLSTYLDAYGHGRSLSLSVQARSKELMGKAQEEVRRVLRQRRSVAPQAEDDFDMSTNESQTETLNQLSKGVKAATFGICILSLLVGGIGILNVMLVAVVERTREIGVRKALGARRRRILFQFTVEATLLALLGGVLGVALGIGVAQLAHFALGVPVATPLWAVALSLTMSSGVGLLFGIYPAARASLLDPVDAMRSE